MAMLTKALCVSCLATQVRRRLRTTEPIAKHASTVYTRAMYEVFDNQLYKSGYYTIDQKTMDGVFVLVDTGQEEFGYRHEITVELRDDNYIKCSCGMFNHMGMLCRHSLKVCMEKREKYKTDSTIVVNDLG